MCLSLFQRVRRNVRDLTLANGTTERVQKSQIGSVANNWRAYSESGRMKREILKAYSRSNPDWQTEDQQYDRSMKNGAKDSKRSLVYVSFVFIFLFIAILEVLVSAIVHMAVN
jgi:hypothetical protein